jgi:putative tryptophan/tyrosine transport system substrate-binding protein
MKMVVLLIGFILASGYFAEAQQLTKIPRIGFINASSPSAILARYEAFRQGLRELGYVEGKNITIEYRYAEGKLDRLREIMAELVSLKVDLIVTAGPSATRAAKEATSIIPIVMALDYDPIGNGFVASLAKPGGNITGLSALYPEMSGKQLELLKEIVPGLLNVVVIGTSTQPGNAHAVTETELAASGFGVKLQYLDVLVPKDIKAAFGAATKGRNEAIVVLAGPVLLSHRTQVAESAVKSRIPVTYQASEYVEAGGLMSYGVTIADLHRRAATYVNKILKDANPAELPVEQPTKFELVINLKTAKQIGLTVPPNVLARADRVIK